MYLGKMVRHFPCPGLPAPGKMTFISAILPDFYCKSEDPVSMLKMPVKTQFITDPGCDQQEGSDPDC
jgi:hypothetical protein